LHRKQGKRDAWSRKAGHEERKFSAVFATLNDFYEEHAALPPTNIKSLQRYDAIISVGRILADTFGTSENKDQEVGSMKNSKTVAAIATALLVSVCLTAAPLQQAPGGPERGGPGAQAPPAAPAQAKTATGELAKVDVAAKEITIKGSDNKEMVFTYTDATQMTGVEGGAQGLTGKTGTTLRVTYQERGGANLASRIEVQEKK
jgi:Cu/Ag efflux protein CusF